MIPKAPFRRFFTNAITRYLVNSRDFLSLVDWKQMANCPSWGARTKHPRLGDLNNTLLFLTLNGDCEVQD